MATATTPLASWRELARAVWIVPLDGGAWAVACAGCRSQLYRGMSRTRAGQVADRHDCRRS